MQITREALINDMAYLSQQKTTYTNGAEECLAKAEQTQGKIDYANQLLAYLDAPEPNALQEVAEKVVISEVETATNEGVDPQPIAVLDDGVAGECAGAE